MNCNVLIPYQFLRRSPTTWTDRRRIRGCRLWIQFPTSNPRGRRSRVWRRSTRPCIRWRQPTGIKDTWKDPCHESELGEPCVIGIRQERCDSKHILFWMPDRDIRPPFKKGTRLDDTIHTTPMTSATDVRNRCQFFRPTIVRLHVHLKNAICWGLSNDQHIRGEMADCNAFVRIYFRSLH